MTQIVSTVHRQVPALVDSAKRKALKGRKRKRWCAWHLGGGWEKPKSRAHQEDYDRVVAMNVREGIDPRAYRLAKEAVPAAIRRLNSTSFGRRKKVTLARVEFLDE